LLKVETLTVASLQDAHFTTSCELLPSRLIAAWHTLQLIIGTPLNPDGTYGGGSSSKLTWPVTAIPEPRNDKETFNANATSCIPPVSRWLNTKYITQQVIIYNKDGKRSSVYYPMGQVIIT
jgi:hypothetical protein